MDNTNGHVDDNNKQKEEDNKLQSKLTSFNEYGSSQDDDDNLQNEQQQEQQQQIKEELEAGLKEVEEKEVSRESEYTYTSLEEVKHSSEADNETLYANDDAKRSLDSILEKLKQNQLSNQEVTNYVLNLLVGGEFDLEKNFIIKHINNILYMIQVIKCAPESSLKAEIWSHFTGILRKSQLNLQACVDIGFIEAALHELQDSDQICADLIIDCLTVLASYSCNVDELKSILFSLKCEDKVWVCESS
jgi:hypothetical protein